MTPLLHSRTVVLDATGRGIDHDAGAMLMLDTLTAGASVDVTWIDASGNDAGTVKGVLLGRKLHAGGGFSGYRLQGQAGTVATLMIGPDASDSASMLSSSLVIGHVVSDVGSVVNVNNVAGAAAYVQPGAGAQFSTKENLAVALTAVAPVACSAVAAVVLAADVTRRTVVFRNVGANAIALGPVGVVFANAAIVLQPTEIWVEKEAPGAAWDAICDAALASTLNVVTAA